MLIRNKIFLVLFFIFLSLIIFFYSCVTDIGPVKAAGKNASSDEMIYIPGGTFIMGSGANDEAPRREVTLSGSFSHVR